MIRRPPRSTQSRSSAASDVYKRQGQGEPVSMEQARVWFGRSAEQGHAKAQFNLGVMNEKGQAGPVSMEQARVGYGRAAEQGHAKAQFCLALKHFKGQGGPVSLEHAIFWFTRAGAQGDNEAMQIVQRMKSTCSLCGKPHSASSENMKTCSGCCLLYTSPSPRDQRGSRMPSSA